MTKLRYSSGPINDNSELILSPANEVFYDIDTLYKDMWEWTEFTEEKWEYLNALHTSMETKP